ncbi:sporulation protein [Cohnella kolymensis]|uniref:Sporulation protein n=1 Tax=Cohnella kolymensis TaxID=1590652 RepID=A0ABR5A9N3_9BACL|nr:aminoglycoside phosphotransferase family protein [Cohnella kolymensis]KIL37122.1 sporulation protein [Cohnella kolymensis]
MSLWSTIEKMYALQIKKTVKIQDVYLIQAASGSYCLKGYDFPEEDVRFIARVFSFLEERGFTRGQRVYATAEQDSYIRHGGVFYTVTNWVPGKRPLFRRRKDFKSAIRTLAKFHSMAAGFPKDEAPGGRIRYAGLHDEVSEYKKVLSRYKNTKHLVPACDEALYGLSQPKVLQAVEAEQNAAALVHGDYNYPNLIKDSRGKTHLIDFENTSLNARMKDLSHILHRNFLWNGSGMLRWVDYYDNKRPLNDNDLHLLHALLTAPYHVVRNIKIGGIRNAKSVTPSSQRLNKFQRELRELL